MPTIREFRANMSHYLSNLPIKLYRNRDLVAFIIHPNDPIAVKMKEQVAKNVVEEKAQKRQLSSPRKSN